MLVNQRLSAMSLQTNDHQAAAVHLIYASYLIKINVVHVSALHKCKPQQCTPDEELFQIKAVFCLPVIAWHLQVK